ncbi:Hpt domain-containing protein [Desulfovibrio gilichinskyi]|uniref:HPt (Histidine-containing phosphotransfer) domain-containing protein n=1 Tax=Desulfovibrio gilichinskyi TaxID=1519643 RepID=A0A1X7EMB9_9BACT|nr:Hpt domain-containing protein [Desulfovibrio gilichinskyi]SMF36297.1 HPt (histidine-containing phosphotransfer) domain-containing protein [Desulfovibrio gilichinskyi]
MDLSDYPDKFNLELALTRFAGDRELLNAAIAIYREEAAKHLITIKKAICEKNWEKASIYAHTLKGESGAVGAIKAHIESDFLEKALRNKELTNIDDMYELVAQEVSIALKVLPYE